MQRRALLLKQYISSEDYVKRLRLRAELLDAANRSVEARASLWQLCAREDNPAEGCIFFIENFGWTLNPKQDPNHFPFILFDYQKDAIRKTIASIDNGLDLFIEKSREMGISWLIFVYIPLWYWLFRDGVNFLLGSYKEKLVDDGTVDSLFGKVDYALDSLPWWMLPKNFNKNKHRTKLKLENPVNSNYITGDTMNANFGRGSRKTAILFDELGFWDYAKEAWESAGDSTDCRIANSTPHGYNYYAMLKDTGIDVLTLHWRLHPLKDEAWYQFEKLRRTEEEVAQELDISYSKSREGRVYPEWTEGFVEKGRYDYDPSLTLYIGWDFGKTDNCAMIWLQRNIDGSYRIIDTYTRTGKNIDFFVPFVTGIFTGENEYLYTEEERAMIEVHKNWKRATHFGDPAGRFQNAVSDETVFSVLKTHGIIVNFKENWKEFNLRKRAAKMVIMDKIYLNENQRSRYFDICMINAAYPRVLVEGNPDIRSDKPRHDYTSHFRSAFEYLCLGLEDFTAIRMVPRDKFKPRQVNPRRAVGY